MTKTNIFKEGDRVKIIRDFFSDPIIFDEEREFENVIGIIVRRNGSRPTTNWDINFNGKISTFDFAWLELLNPIDILNGFLNEQS